MYDANREDLSPHPSDDDDYDEEAVTYSARAATTDRTTRQVAVDLFVSHPPWLPSLVLRMRVRCIRTVAVLFYWLTRLRSRRSVSRTRTLQSTYKPPGYKPSVPTKDAPTVTIKWQPMSVTAKKAFYAWKRDVHGVPQFLSCSYCEITRKTFTLASATIRRKWCSGHRLMRHKHQMVVRHMVW